MGINELTDNIIVLLPAVLNSNEAWLLTQEDFQHVGDEKRFAGYLLELNDNCNDFPHHMISFLNDHTDNDYEDFEETIIELSSFYHGIWHESKSGYFESSFIFYNILLFCFANHIYFDSGSFNKMRTANVCLESDWENKREHICAQVRSKMISLGYSDLDSIARLSEVIFIMIKKCDIFSKTVEGYCNENHDNGYMVAYLYLILILTSDLISNLYLYEVEWMRFYNWVKVR